MPGPYGSPNRIEPNAGRGNRTGHCHRQTAIVVDTNIISRLYLSTKQTVLVEQMLQKNSRWAAPLLWKSEFRSVLALYLRKKVISLEKALAIQQEAGDFLQENEFEVPSA